MRARINDAVALEIKRQVIAVLRTVKGKLENLHARETGVAQKLPDAVGQISQIFCQDVQVPEFLFQRFKESDARSFFPVPVLGIFIAVRNGIIFIKSPEMIHSQDAEQFEAVRNAADPPVVVTLPQILPVIKRVPPQLAVCRKSVRRASGDCRRIPLGIKLEKLRICPGIGTVERHINRNVPDEADALLLRVGAECFPLTGEFILLELPEADLLPELRACGMECFRLAESQVLIPFAPASAFIFLFQCHEQRIVFEPVGIFLCKTIEVFILLFREPAIGGAQGFESAPVHLSVIDGGSFLPEIECIALLFFQESLLDQSLQIDEVRISRKGRKTLVGRIAEPRRSERQDLPVGLSGLFQEIDKVAGFLRKTADSVFRGQTGNGAQDSGTPSVDMRFFRLIRQFFRRDSLFFIFFHKIKHSGTSPMRFLFLSSPGLPSLRP